VRKAVTKVSSILKTESANSSETLATTSKVTLSQNRIYNNLVRFSFEIMSQNNIDNRLV
jgi:hypothetical protein